MVGKKREYWGSRIGVILAVTGSAVGLGNFLRFPGQAAKYGGGAFLIPYIVAFLVVGLPMAWAEWALGRYGGARGHNSSPGIFRVLLGSRKGVYIGMLGTLVPLGSFFGFLFFFLLFLAAITSSLSMLQPSIALLEEGLKIGRKASVSILAFITLVGCLFVAYFSKGFTALDTLDFWMANFFIFIFATFQSIVFAWVLGIRKGMEELRRGAEIRLPRTCLSC